MTQQEIMQMAAEKAVNELSWKSIEFLFQPTNMLELYLRLDLDGMRQKIHDWANDDSPNAMPHRFRPKHLKQMLRAIEVEEFYQKMKSIRDKSELPVGC